MDTIKAANKFIREGITLLPDEAKKDLQLFLNENEINRYIVRKARDMVDNLIRNKEKFFEAYLSTRRERVKSPLAVFFAVTVPERTYAGMDKLLTSVPWKNYKAIRNLFAPFDIFADNISFS